MEGAAAPLNRRSLQLIFLSYRRRAYFSARCVVAKALTPPCPPPSPYAPSPAFPPRPSASRSRSDFPILMTQISFIRSLFANYGREEGRKKGWRGREQREEKDENEQDAMGYGSPPGEAVGERVSERTNETKRGGGTERERGTPPSLALPATGDNFPAQLLLCSDRCRIALVSLGFLLRGGAHTFSLPICQEPGECPSGAQTRLRELGVDVRPLSSWNIPYIHCIWTRPSRSRSFLVDRTSEILQRRK